MAAQPGDIRTIREPDRVLMLLAADVDAGGINKASAQVAGQALRLLRRDVVA